MTEILIYIYILGVHNENRCFNLDDANSKIIVKKSIKKRQIIG